MFGGLACLATSKALLRAVTTHRGAGRRRSVRGLLPMVGLAMDGIL